jgi:hypothetical protein
MPIRVIVAPTCRERDKTPELDSRRRCPPVGVSPHSSPLTLASLIARERLS